MANSIELAKRYATNLDEIYQREALTSVLEADQQLLRFVNAATVLLPEMQVSGLGNYSRATGYPAGDVTLSWTPYTLSQDRGRSFQVDEMDDEESVGLAFGRLAAEFMRTQVIPEIDAYRLARLAQKADNSASGTLDKDTIIPAIDAATTTLDDAQVPQEGRVLFISAAGASALRQSTSYVRNVDIRTRGGLDRRVDTFDGMPVIVVPKARFYTKIVLLDGASAGQTAGGYQPAVDAAEINFLIVHLNAALAITKHEVPRIFDPRTNQAANAWKFDYRIYHDLIVPDNKTPGIYVHTKSGNGEGEGEEV